VRAVRCTPAEGVIHESHVVHNMTEVQNANAKKTLGSKLASTVLVFTVPLLLLAIMGLFSGSLGIGTVEISLLWVIWMVGLAWVWCPRRS